MVTESSGATMSLPRTLTLMRVPGAAVRSSSTATGGWGAPGGTTAMRTVF